MTDYSDEALAAVAAKKALEDRKLVEALRAAKTPKSKTETKDQRRG